MSDAERPDVRRVPKYPNSEDERAMSEQANADETTGAGPGCDSCLGTGRVGTSDNVIPCPACAESKPDPNAKLYEANERKLEQYRADATGKPASIHPVDAFVNAAEQWFPGKPISEELLAQARVWCDTPVCSTCGGAGEIDERLGGIATSGIVPCPDCSAPSAHADAGDLIAVERVIAELRQQIADLEAKLEAERTLRAQASAELEREKARERERRLESDGWARDRLWAIDALVEALAPLAGFATEEDGRVAGMTNPVCLAMSSVRRADALVKLHRALRR